MKSGNNFSQFFNCMASHHTLLSAFPPFLIRSLPPSMQHELLLRGGMQEALGILKENLFRISKPFNLWRAVIASAQAVFLLSNNQ